MKSSRSFPNLILSSPLANWNKFTIAHETADVYFDRHSTLSVCSRLAKCEKVK